MIENNNVIADSIYHRERLTELCAALCLSLWVLCDKKVSQLIKIKMGIFSNQKFTEMV